MSLAVASLGSFHFGLSVLPGLLCPFLNPVRQVFSHYYSNRFSVLCCLFTTSGAPIMHMFSCLILSQRFLKLSFFVDSSPSSCSEWMFFMTLSSNSLSQSSGSIIRY